MTQRPSAIGEGGWARPELERRRSRRQGVDLQALERPVIGSLLADSLSSVSPPCFVSEPNRRVGQSNAAGKYACNSLSRRNHEEMCLVSPAYGHLGKILHKGPTQKGRTNANSVSTLDKDLGEKSNPPAPISGGFKSRRPKLWHTPYAHVDPRLTPKPTRSRQPETRKQVRSTKHPAPVAVHAGSGPDFPRPKPLET